MVALPSLPTTMSPSSMLPATMRFKVTIDGQDVGSWSHCANLSVKFDNKTFADSATQNVTVVPGQPSYEPVKLRRAMTQKGVAEVRAWLNKYATKPEPTTATIKLVDSWDLTICEWSLTNVVPKSWGCADLDGSSSTKTVALETLELSHDGFMDAGKVGAHFVLRLSNDDLGSWSSCDGLSVEFKNSMLNVDTGKGTTQEWRPGSLAYETLTLTRLMVEDQSTKLQKFLDNWAKSPTVQPLTGSLELMDAWGKVLGTWTLQGVVPKKWKAPKLDAALKVAPVEQLELSYTGFLNPDPKVGGGFTVEMGTRNLGSWTVLKGLSVELPTERVRTAGGTSTKAVAKGAPKHNAVTLQRPLDAKQAADLQKWLSEAADQRGQSVTITVQDAYGNAGAKWTLVNAIPKQWNGPELDADGKAGQVPVETVVIEHDGFVQESGEGSAGGKEASGALANKSGTAKTPVNSEALEKQYATVSAVGDDSKKVAFAADPHSITTSRTARYVTVPNATGSKTVGHGRNEYRGSGAATLAVEVELLGIGEGAKASIEAQCAQLQAWMAPSGSAKPPALLDFKWCSVEFKGYLRDLVITVDQFGIDTKPARARASFTLQEEPAVLPKTNPTSGGPPGRRARVLCEGESLQSVAFGEYGDAADWRMLADANGIDDPLRVAAGTQLLIPPAA